ncbi:MAG: hypothetical protein QOE70_6198 [Chthoniobacter sp.]|jgi:hypothetical protein|nr:hypothetical protein [Chthoniobacter sp.]
MLPEAVSDSRGKVPPAPKPCKIAKAQANFALKAQLEALCGVGLTAVPKS